MASPSDLVRPDPETKIVVLGIYWQTKFWSLGPRAGVNSFFNAPHSFVEHGHTIHMSMPRGPGQPAFEIHEGMHLHRYAGAISFDSSAKGWMPIRLFSRVTRFLYYLVIATWNGWRVGRRVRPDIVIGYHYHAALPARLVGRALGVPSMLRLFGTQLRRVIDHPLKRYGAFIQYFALKTYADAILIHDDGSEGDVVARRLGVPDGRLFFWRDGYEPSFYQPGVDQRALRRKLGIPADHVILFCVGRMEEDKRMDRLVEMLPAVLQAEPKVTLMLIGDGSDRVGIERRRRELGIEANVVLTGPVTRDELAPYLNVGDIFVGVSDRTNANVPPIEAMSCAKPLVVMNTGGTSTLIQDGLQGLLVDPARWEEELPKAIVSLARDPAKRAAMGLAGLETVRRLVPTIEDRQKAEVDLAVRISLERRGRRTDRSATSGGGARG